MMKKNNKQNQKEKRGKCVICGQETADIHYFIYDLKVDESGTCPIGEFCCDECWEDLIADYCF